VAHIAKLGQVMCRSKVET